MNQILRITTKISTFSPFFRIQKGNTNPFIIFTSIFHTKNKHKLILSDLHYAFDSINNINEALALFEYMLQMNPPPPIFHFNYLFQSVVKMKQYHHVILMFKKLRVLRCEVSEYTMNIVINCYCHVEEVDLSYAVVGGFFKRGYVPDMFTFNCLIKGLFIKGKVDEAIGLFKRLVKGRLFNEITLSIVLDGLSKSGYIGDAVELLRLSEKRNWKLDVHCYTAVIDGLCKGGMLKDGMGVLVRMVDRDVVPDVVSYTCLLYGLCMNGKLDFACSIFNDLLSKGVCPDVFTYNVMIQGFCRRGMFRDAKELLEKMERIGCFPNGVTYNIIIQGCLHHRDNFYSIDLLKEIMGRDFQLDAPSFFVLLRAIQVLHQMKGVYNDDVINQLIHKLTSSAAIHQMRDKDDEFMISSSIRKLSSGDSRYGLS